MHTSWSSRLRELLLWVGAALGLLAVATAVAVAFFGFSFLVFRSGSMAPEIPTGGLAFSQTVGAEDIEAGDVVSVVAANGERITHRVVSTALRGDEATLVLKGDANATEDSELYVVTSVERVVFSVPFGGYVVAHLLTPPGMVGAVCLTLMFLLLGFSRRDDDDDRDPGDQGDEPTRNPGSTQPGGRHLAPRRRTVHLVSAGVVLVGLLSGGALAATSTDGTLAAFTDPARADAGSLTAAKVAVPGNVKCAASGFLGTQTAITWTAPAGAAVDEYILEWTRSRSSDTVTVPADRTYWRPSGLLPGTYTVQVRTAAGTWSSPLSAADTITVGLFGAIYC